MKKYTTFLLPLLLAVALMLPAVAVPARADSEIRISSPAGILVEVGSGNVIFEKNAYTARFPASLTKIMTLLLACEYIEHGIVKQDELVPITEDAWALLDEDSTNLALMPGEEISFLDLMYCAMLASANEACNAIAIHTCGDINTFVTEMNRRAVELGCRDTHFVTTNGLHDNNHYSTAYDMYLITAEAIKHPLFRQIFGTKYYATSATNLNEPRRMYHTNRLMNSEHPSYYEYCTGGKTGSTSEAGYCLVSMAQKEGVEFICVIMGAGRTEQEDGSFTLDTYTDSVALYEWGFSNFSYQTVLSTRASIASIPVYMGDGADAVDMVPTENVTLFLPNEGAGDALQVSVSLYDEASNGNLRAPVAQGSVLGEITVYYNDRVVATVKGVAAGNVNLKHSEYIRSELNTTLSMGWVKKAIAFFIGVFVLYALYIVLYLIIRAARRRRSFSRAQSYAARIRRSAPVPDRRVPEQSAADAAAQEVLLSSLTPAEDPEDAAPADSDEAVSDQEEQAKEAADWTELTEPLGAETPLADKAEQHGDAEEALSPEQAEETGSESPEEAEPAESGEPALEAESPEDAEAPDTAEIPKQDEEPEDGKTSGS